MLSAIGSWCPSWCPCLNNTNPLLDDKQSSLVTPPRDTGLSPSNEDDSSESSRANYEPPKPYGMDRESIGESQVHREGEAFNATIEVKTTGLEALKDPMLHLSQEADLLGSPDSGSSAGSTGERMRTQIEDARTRRRLDFLP